MDDQKRAACLSIHWDESTMYLRFEVTIGREVQFSINPVLYGPDCIEAGIWDSLFTAEREGLELEFGRVLGRDREGVTYG